MSLDQLPGLRLALKYCTNYNDRMFLQFLIKAIEDGHPYEWGSK